MSHSIGRGVIFSVFLHLVTTIASVQRQFSDFNCDVLHWKKHSPIPDYAYGKMTSNVQMGREDCRIACTESPSCSVYSHSPSSNYCAFLEESVLQDPPGTWATLDMFEWKCLDHFNNHLTSCSPLYIEDVPKRVNVSSASDCMGLRWRPIHLSTSLLYDFEWGMAPGNSNSDCEQKCKTIHACAGFHHRSETGMCVFLTNETNDTWPITQANMSLAYVWQCSAEWMRIGQLPSSLASFELDRTFNSTLATCEMICLEREGCAAHVLMTQDDVCITLTSGVLGANTTNVTGVISAWYCPAQLTAIENATVVRANVSNCTDISWIRHDKLSINLSQHIITAGSTESLTTCIELCLNTTGCAAFNIDDECWLFDEGILQHEEAGLATLNKTWYEWTCIAMTQPICENSTWTKMSTVPENWEEYVTHLWPTASIAACSGACLALPECDGFIYTQVERLCMSIGEEMRNLTENSTQSQLYYTYECHSE